MAVRTTGARTRSPHASGRGGVSAILLAAGTSSRMGEPKPLVRIAGRPLLSHALSALRESDVEEIVVVLGADAERVRREVSLEGAHVVPNPEFRQGMSTSIRAGLRAANPEAEAFLIVLGDQPLVRPATLDALIAREESSRARILVPTYCGVRGNPVLLHRSVVGEVEAIEGDVGCRDVVHAHADEVVEVSVDDPGILIDVDTPEEVHRLEETLARGAPLDSLVADRVREAARATEDRTRKAATRTRIDVDALAHEMTQRGETFAVATVVRVIRPTSGKPGDKAVVRENGTILGFVGGSCTGSSVVVEGLAAIRDGRPRLLRLTPDPGVEPAAEGVVEYPMECLSGGLLEIYIEPRSPKPRLLVVGPSPIAEALSALGHTMEFQVFIVAPRAFAEAYPDAEQFLTDLDALGSLATQDAYAVVATMGKYDETALRALASSPAAYVGLVGSRRRASGVLESLRKGGVPEIVIKRITSPAGLDIAAKTAEEIALSILAEIVQVRRTSGPTEVPVVETTPATGGHTKAVDMVCGMEVDLDTPLKAVHEGTMYYFCSDMCRTRFLESPGAFLI